ncbi:O-antigen ligase family protein [Fulvivirga imtechensis]|nr:O-antigen ligase family protein [Fulvivirga imtechensis]
MAKIISDFGKLAIKYEAIPVLLCYVLIALLPFDLFVISLIIILLSVSALMICDKTRWWLCLKSGWKFYLPLLAFYIYHVIGLGWTSNYHEGFRSLEYKLSFLVLPLIMALINLDSRTILRLFNVFIIINLVLVILSFLHFIFIDITQDEFIILGEKVEGNRVGTRGEYLSKHFLIIDQHRTFYSIQLVISVWFLLNYIPFLRKMTKKKVIAITSSVFILISGILVMQSKLSYLLLALTIITSLILHFKLIPKSALISALLVIIASLLFTNELITDRFEKMVDEVEYIFSDGDDQTKTFATKLRPGSSEIRYMLYKSSLQVISESFLFGHGTGDVRDMLKEQNYKNGYISIAHLNYGAHSQLLHSSIAFGIIGIILLFSIFLIPLSSEIKKRNYFTCGVLVIFLIACIFESYLNSRAGIIPVAFFIPLLSHFQFQHFNKK